MSAGIGLAFSAASALGSIRQGQAQAAGLEARGQGLLVQADFETLKGRQDSLKSKREAVNQLQAIIEGLARTTAVAGAGHIDPFSGSPEGVKIKALDVGGLNVVTAKENEQITRLVANFQADQLAFASRQAFHAASAARTGGITSALFTLGAGLFSFGQAGGFGDLFKSTGGLKPLQFGGGPLSNASASAPFAVDPTRIQNIGFGSGS